MVEEGFGRAAGVAAGWAGAAAGFAVAAALSFSTNRATCSCKAVTCGARIGVEEGFSLWFGCVSSSACSGEGCLESGLWGCQAVVICLL